MHLLADQARDTLPKGQRISGRAMRIAGFWPESIIGSLVNLKDLDDESFKYGVPFSRHDDAFDGQTDSFFIARRNIRCGRRPLFPNICFAAKV